MTHEKDAFAESRREKYGHLPPSVGIDDMYISVETRPVPDSDLEGHVERTIGSGSSGTAM